MSKLFIDFLTLMLFNMAAGLFILAFYLCRGLDDPDQGRWAPAFGIVGLVALLNGFRVSWVWPLPQSYNAAYGDLSVLFGALFAGAALALAKGWKLLPLTIYALVAGLASILAGVAFIHLQLSKFPVLSGIGFILTGICGVFSGPTLCMPHCRILRPLGVVVTGCRGDHLGV